MLSPLKHADAKREGGFTLIELLVVVIIIGILAAIAIPVFLAQRERAWRSAAQSDLRNAAVSLETYFTDTGAYGGTIDNADQSANTGAFESSTTQSFGFNPTAAVAMNVTYGTANQSYCMLASHESHDELWYLGSGGTLSSPEVNGGSSALGCPASSFDGTVPTGP